VDGLKVKAEDLDGNYSLLEQTVSGFKQEVAETYVSEDGFEEKYKSVSEQTAKEINNHFEALDKFKNDTTANIKTGLLGYTEDDTPIPIYGIEIGQQTENAEGEKVFDKYARFTSDKLSFYDQSSNEVASIGDEKMTISHVEIVGNLTSKRDDYGSFKQGKFVDTTRADGTIVSKWVGGV
jgi:hypothetical protein